MFDISIWAWYGVGLFIAYIVLVWFGFAERKRERQGDSESSLVSKRPATTTRHQHLDQNCENRDEYVVAPPRVSTSCASEVRLRIRRVDASSIDEPVVDDEDSVAVQCIPVLESRNFDLQAGPPGGETTQEDLLRQFASRQAASVIDCGLQSLRERIAHMENRKDSPTPDKPDQQLERGEPEASVEVLSAFANGLVENTMLSAFQCVGTAAENVFAGYLSSKVLVEAFSEVGEGNIEQVEQRVEFNSSVPGAGDNASTKQNIQIFAEDFSEQVLTEGLDAVAVKEADIVKIQTYSNGLVNTVIADGTLMAGKSYKESTIQVSSPASPITKHAQHLTSELCQMAYEEVVLSSSLQSSVTGVVENVINGAIVEAVSKVRESGASTDEQDGRFEMKTCSDKDQSIRNGSAALADGLVTGALDEVVLLSHSESSVVKHDQNLHGLTGQEPLRGIANAEETECNNNLRETVVRRIPSRNTSTEQQENGKEKKPSGFWRQSLLLDLEEDEDYDDNSSEASCGKQLDAAEQGKSPPADHSSSEEESSEFIDSSEDEIIDHAEEAKLGAVGGKRNLASNSAPVWDESEEMEELDAEVTVDGLCMSRPKKHKNRSLPRARLQSVDSRYNQPVVLDNGCGIIKLGMAGDKRPMVTQPSIVGTPQRYSLQMTGMDHKKHLKYGDVAMGAAGVMHLGYPMSAGLIDNWTDIEDLWEYLLYDNLGIEEGSHPVLVTEVADNHPKNRAKIGEIMFEHLSVPALYLVNQLSLSLYASGLTTGVCLSSGFSVTQAAVIYEGYMLKHSLQQLDVAGQGLTNNFKQLLRDNRGHNLPSSSGWQIVNSMKEHLAYVSKDFEAEMEQYKTNAGLTTHYKLPDGQMIDIHGEQIQSVEPLFAPSTLVLANDTVASQSPMHKLVHDSMRRCDSEVQDTCYRNVVLSGGTTKLPGLVPRLENELGQLNPKIRKLRAPDNRDLSPWIGGSILASLSTFDSMFVTVDEYADAGARVVNQKCF